SSSGAFGPIMGGVLADQIGMRPTFYVSAGLLIVAFLLITLAFREDQQSVAQARAERQKVSAWSMFRVPAFLAVMVALLMTQAIDYSFGLILPFFVSVLEGNDA